MPTFNDFYLKGQKPKAKRYQRSDGKGFILRVTPTGTKSFHFRYEKEGKDCYLHLGDYPFISIADARKKYNLVYDAFKHGQDPRKFLFAPIAARNPTPSAEEPLPTEFTVGMLAEEFLTEWFEASHTARTSYIARVTIKKHLKASWWDKPAASLKSKDAYKLIDKISLKTPGAANNVIKYCRAMYNYGVRMEHVEYNPFLVKFSDHSPRIVPQPKDRVLDAGEIRFIWKAIEEGPGSSEVKRAIKLILVTAQRPSEVSGMLRSEIDGDWWTIPAERIKTEKKIGLPRKPRPHMVYLTSMAWDLIGKVPGWSGDVVFPVIKGHNKRTGKSGEIKSVLGNALNKRISKLDVAVGGVVKKEPYYGLPEWSPHDLRRTADTMMNSIGIDHRHVEMVLNHTLSKVEGTYNLYQYNMEKQVALQKWSEKLQEIISE